MCRIFQSIYLIAGCIPSPEMMLMKTKTNQLRMSSVWFVRFLGKLVWCNWYGCTSWLRGMNFHQSSWSREKTTHFHCLETVQESTRAFQLGWSHCTFRLSTQAKWRADELSKYFKKKRKKKTGEKGVFTGELKSSVGSLPIHKLHQLIPRLSCTPHKEKCRESGMGKHCKETNFWRSKGQLGCNKRAV